MTSILIACADRCNVTGYCGCGCLATNAYAPFGHRYEKAGEFLKCLCQFAPAEQTDEYETVCHCEACESAPDYED